MKSFIIVNQRTVDSPDLMICFSLDVLQNVKGLFPLLVSEASLKKRCFAFQKLLYTKKRYSKEEGN